MKTLSRWWASICAFMNSTVPPEAFKSSYDPEHSNHDHVSAYEHPNKQRARARGYDY